ncbi:unnamed protein product [Diabrotica balteata]|uniref:Uncharacterized protein n=1 Tax=Diabrotica balteata TaxID=107213 RepID=A0A9N9SZA2_DIABA|nr:unnamed protein product [Diabrotica balteata]
MISLKVFVAAFLVVFAVSVQCIKFKGGYYPGPYGHCCGDCSGFDRYPCDNYRGGCNCPIPIVLSPTVGLLTKLKAKFLSKICDGGWDDCDCGCGGYYGNPWMRKFGKFGGCC